MKALPERGNGKAEDGYLDVVGAVETGSNIILHDGNGQRIAECEGRGQAVMRLLGKETLKNLNRWFKFRLTVHLEIPHYPLISDIVIHDNRCWHSFGL